MDKFHDWYGQVEFCSLPLLKQNIGQKHWIGAKIDWKWKTISEWVYLVSYFDVFFKRCIVLDETTVQNWSKFNQEWILSF